MASLSLALLAFSLAQAVRVPLWFDEAHTYWVVRDGFASLFGKLAQDVHPPLYFCLVSWMTSVLGFAPWALRLVSVVAAAATVPVAYWAARGVAGRPWALGVALLVATHPLFEYYAGEARSYALLVLLLTATAGMIFRASAPAAGAKEWGGLTALLVLLLQTDNLAVFVFPPLVLMGARLGGPRWRAVGLRLVAAEAIAFALYLPWFVTAVGAEGGVAWVANFWSGSVKWLGPIRSLLAFGPGAEYPSYLGPPGAITGLPVVGAVLTALLLLASLARPREAAADASEAAPRPAVQALWLGATSLMLLWGYSWIRRPIYLVGRYDLVAFPLVALLLGLGARAVGERLRRPAVGGVLLGLCVAVNVAESAQLWTRIGVGAPPPVDIAVKFLADRGAGHGDLVIARGQMAFLILRYASDRAGQDLEFAPFPAAVGRHPGWYEADIFLRDPARLEADAADAARRVAAALAAGRRVWLVDEGDPRVDGILIAALARVAVPDAANSSVELRIFSLRSR